APWAQDEVIDILSDRTTRPNASAILAGRSATREFAFRGDAMDFESVCPAAERDIDVARILHVGVDDRGAAQRRRWPDANAECLRGGGIHILSLMPRALGDDVDAPRAWREIDGDRPVSHCHTPGGTSRRVADQ